MSDTTQGVSWRPLAGIKVLDLTAMLPGPFASQVLADLGATVVKVERPPRGEAMRALQPHMFDVINRGKTSLAIDLKDASDVELLLTLAREADVFMEGFRPGVLDRLGAGFDAVSACQPSVIYMSLSGWGQDGPLADDPGHNGTFVARTGGMFLSGDEAQPPTDAFPFPVADLSASLYAVIAILASLRETERQARHLDVSLFGGALAFMTPRLAEFTGSAAQNRDEIMVRPANGVFPCIDGHILIAAVEDHFWPGLCSALELDDLATRDDLRRYGQRFVHTAEINARVSEKTSALDRDTAVAVLRGAGVPVSPVLAPSEVESDPQVEHFGFFPQRGDFRSFLPITGVTPFRPNEPTVYNQGGDAIRATGWAGVS